MAGDRNQYRMLFYLHAAEESFPEAVSSAKHSFPEASGKFFIQCQCRELASDYLTLNL